MRRRLRDTPPWVLFLASTLLVAALFPLSVVLTGQISASDNKAAAAADSRKSLADSSGDLAAQVKLLCSQGKLVGEVCGKASAVQTQAQQPSPKNDQRALVQVEVARYCAANNGCKGDKGTAPPVDQGAIVNAVLARIPTPTNGTDGVDAPAVTAKQIEAAVEAYCSDGACIGPAGKDGADGQPGEPGEPGEPGAKGDTGRGISAVTFNCAGGSATVTYDDGTSADTPITCPDNVTTVQQPPPTTGTSNGARGR